MYNHYSASVSAETEMVQMWLIENNYAKAVSEPPNTKHDDLLSESEEK